MREHLIDAFNRTQDYWRYCLRKLRYRETRARSDIAGFLLLPWMTPALRPRMIENNFSQMWGMLKAFAPSQSYGHRTLYDRVP